LKFSAKKGCFLSFERENQISPLLAPLEKFRKTPLVPPQQKSFRRPWPHLNILMDLDFIISA